MHGPFRRRIKEIEGIGNVDRKLARAIEHLLIQEYGRIGKDVGGTLTNVNRGIDPKKLWKYKKELLEAKNIIGSL